MKPKQFMKNTITTFLLILLFAFSGNSCAQKEKGQNAATAGSDAQEVVVSMIAPDALDAINEGIQLVDVRTPEEFASGHLENAVNINFYADDFKEQINQLDKEKEVYLYCRSGGRSAKAAKDLEAMGFRKVYDLEGGILKWQKKKLKIIY